MKKSKYGNRKIERDGMTFDSVREYNRWRELILLQRAGEISSLARQVKFELLPTQRVDGKVVERAIHYIADFVYTENGKTVVEDSKGYKTPEYKLKRKLLLWRFGIQIRES